MFMGWNVADTFIFVEKSSYTGKYYFCRKSQTLGQLFIYIGSYFLVGIFDSKIGHYTAWVKGYHSNEIL